MRKKTILFTILTFLGLVGFIALFRKATDAERCVDKIFQNSPAYAKGPRRLFEMTRLKNPSIMDFSYLISYQCHPELVVSGSSLSCRITSSLAIPEDQADKLKALVDCRRNKN